MICIICKLWHFNLFFLSSMHSLFFMSDCLARTCNAMLNKAQQSWHPCVAPVLKRYVFYYFTVEYDVGYLFVIYSVCYVKIVPSILTLLGFLSLIYVDFLSKAFSASIKIIIGFNLLIYQCDISHWLFCSLLNHPYIPGINLTWSCAWSFKCIIEYNLPIFVEYFCILFLQWYWPIILLLILLWCLCLVLELGWCWSCRMSLEAYLSLTRIGVKSLLNVW